jgi:hypothetical protein
MSTSQLLPPGTRIAEHMSLAQLFSAIPMKNVKEALCKTDANDLRERDLPAKYMTYFVIAMSLYSYCSSREVFQNLVETLKNIYGPLTELKIPVKSALTNARKRLGSESLKYLFQSTVKPIAVAGETVGAFFRGYRKVGIDGVQFNIQDTVENANAFARSKTGSGTGSYPFIRLVGLVELGTRVMFDYEMTPSRKEEDANVVKKERGEGKRKEAEVKEVSENELASILLTRLKADQICLGDRLYANYKLASIIQNTGARYLLRVKSDVRLDCERVLEDGSFTSKLYFGDRQKSKEFIEVRVIEYTIKQGDKAEPIRLITNMMTCADATNAELSELYHERWEFENANKEYKQELNAYLDVLRSKTPELVEQELTGVLLLHYATRTIMHEAALRMGWDVDRLSFKHSISVIRRRAPQVGAFPPRRSLRSHS